MKLVLEYFESCHKHWKNSLTGLLYESLVPKSDNLINALKNRGMVNCVKMALFLKIDTKNYGKKLNIILQTISDINHKVHFTFCDNLFCWHLIGGLPQSRLTLSYYNVIRTISIF